MRSKTNEGLALARSQPRPILGRPVSYLVGEIGIRQPALVEEDLRAYCSTTPGRCEGTDSV